MMNQPDTPIEVFDRRSVRHHRDRASATIDEHSFLLDAVASQLTERLDEINRTFPTALNLGCQTGQLHRHLQGRGGIEMLLHCDLSPRMALCTLKQTGAPTLVADEEWLPFADHSLDLVIGCLSLHWVNDLPGALAQIRRALKPDGLFLAALFGGDTLKELRQALTESELAGEGGMSPRVSPFVDVRDAGDLLQRTGFTLPLADIDTLTVSYPDAFKLMADLRAMGETNAVSERRKNFSRRTTLMETAQRYHELFADDEDRIPATFQVISLTAWAPHPDQQQALNPGSATSRLAKALDAEEIAAGEKAKP